MDEEVTGALDPPFERGRGKLVTGGIPQGAEAPFAQRIINRARKGLEHAQSDSNIGTDPLDTSVQQVILDAIDRMQDLKTQLANPPDS